MESNSMSVEVRSYILKNYEINTPIFVKDIYNSFPAVNKNTIRSIINRFAKEQMLLKIRNGIYTLPKQSTVLKKPIVYLSDFIEKLYISDKKEVFGYTSGINFANYLGLTTQTASVNFIISNKVARKKRLIKLRNTRIIVTGPRVKINSKNYKLLQVLDLLNDYKTFSEVDFNEAQAMILDYMSDLKLDEKEKDIIVSTYPTAAQAMFYKMERRNVSA